MRQGMKFFSIFVDFVRNFKNIYLLVRQNNEGALEIFS